MSRKSFRLKTLALCMVVLVVILIICIGAVLYSINVQYRMEFSSLYDRLLSESLSLISEDLVRIHTILGSVASDKALKALLEDTSRSPGQVVNDLQISVKPMLSTHQFFLSEWCDLYILHSNRSFPSLDKLFFYDELCSSQGIEWLRSLPFSGNTTMRRHTDAAGGKIFLYRPIHSRLTLKMIGVACVEIDVDTMLQSRLSLDSGVCVYDEDGAVIWRNQAEANAPVLQTMQREIEGLGLRFEMSIPYHTGLYSHSALARNATWLVIVLTLILGVCVLVYLSFLSQLRRLIGDMQRIAGGDRDARVGVYGSNELTQVAVTCNAILDEASQMLDRAIQSGQTEKKAVYLALSNQLRPHFLNNALDSVRMQCSRAGDERTATALTHIMRYLSYNLGRQDVGVTLTEELSSVSNYVEMLRLANDSAIDFDIVPRGNMYGRLSEYTLPKFTLQPIVENCVRHGFAEKQDTPRVMITIEHEDGQIFLSVEDNGAGMSQSQLKAVRDNLERREDRVRESGMGISLNLVRRRLELFYDREIPFTIDSYEGTGTMITFAVPDQRRGGDGV